MDSRKLIRSILAALLGDGEDHFNRVTLKLASLISASLLVLMLVIGLIARTTQQAFELVMVADDYARKLLLHASHLRLIIAVDNLFIFSYLVTSVLAWRLINEQRLAGGIFLGLLFSAGILDVWENFTILKFIAMTEAGSPPDILLIGGQMALSTLKWYSGFAGFTTFGLILRPHSQIATWIRVAFITLPMPVVVTYFALAYSAWEPVVSGLRYGALLSGFLMLALLSAGDSRNVKEKPKSKAKISLRKKKK